MYIGYARVSTDDQNLDIQIHELKQAGCDKIFQEKLSGANRQRPELAKLLEQLREGDAVVIWKLDRLARSTRDLLDIADVIAKAGAGLKSLSEPWADTTSPAGRMVLTVFAGIAEFERELIRERTGTGRSRRHEARRAVRAARQPEHGTGRAGKAVARRRQIRQGGRHDLRRQSLDHLSGQCGLGRLAMTRRSGQETNEFASHLARVNKDRYAGRVPILEFIESGFQVKERTLSDQEREALRQAVKGVFNTHKRKATLAGMGNILATQLPDVIADLQFLKNDPEKPQIYVLHNLPEAPSFKLPEDDAPYFILLQEQIRKRSFASYICKGLFEAVGVLPNTWPSLLLRGKNAAIIGPNIHQDGKNISGLAGVITDGAPTRFVHLPELLQEALSAGLGDIKLKVEIRGKKERDRGQVLKLQQVVDHLPKLSKDEYFILADHPAEAQANRETFEQIVRQHAYSTVVGPGDLVIWSNKGQLYHQALPGQGKGEGPLPDRVVIAH